MNLDNQELKQEFTRDYLKQLNKYVDKLPCATSENYNQLVKDIRFKYIPGKTTKFKH